ncbi:hypothetical protein Ddye_020279 [Dipteronia dyeriana]|uniref:Exonuclease domain-containing protein n=1 Tax=Dipteronia dyeriana TaxID=168575 RepID=A0AAD9TZC2_9ROSI|nr:hypothetical protein Ddye_020279 [Dipteronia dyeriana]
MRAITSILQIPRRRIQPFSFLQSATLSEKSSQALTKTCPGSYSKPGSNRGTKSRFMPSHFTSIKYSDAEQMKILVTESRELKNLSGVYVMDLETTGFYDRCRIIEFGARNLLGGKNSCFETLVNPEQYVPNSHVHGITTNMVNQPYVPRMEDLIPILMQHTKNRQVPKGHALFIAHNGRRFDVPFLIKEFSRCNMDIPTDWLFLDTLPLAREYMKLYGPLSPKLCLQTLREYFEIPSIDSSHRAMSDVNVLSSIFEKMICDMNLTITDLLERSFKASDLVIASKKNMKN